jgi:hypothetical protein
MLISKKNAKSQEAEIKTETKKPFTKEGWWSGSSCRP